MLDANYTPQGYNRCLTNATPFTPRGGGLHETAAVNPFALRYVEAPLTAGWNNAGNYWNRINTTGAKAVHAFIGKDITGKAALFLTLPTDWPCWGIGGGKLGSYNYDPTKYRKLQRGTLQIEICRGSKDDVVYYREAIAIAERIYAIWARVYGFDPTAPMDNGKTFQMTCHAEAARAGFASNHGDPIGYMKWFGDDMNQFRQRVKARMADAEEIRYTYEVAMPTLSWRPTKRYNAVGILQELLIKLGYNVSVDYVFGAETHAAVKHFRETHGIPTPRDRKGNELAVTCNKETWLAINDALNGGRYTPTAHYTVTANAKLRVYTNDRKSKLIGRVAKGSKVEVVGLLGRGYLAPVKLGAVVGWADARQMVNRTEIK